MFPSETRAKFAYFIAIVLAILDVFLVLMSRPVLTGALLDQGGLEGFDGANDGETEQAASADSECCAAEAVAETSEGV